MKSGDRQTGLVTGATSGVGRAIAEGMAAAGMRVLLVCRELGRGRETAEQIVRATGNGNIEILQADMADLSSVRSLADTVRSRFDRLHVLSNNAAVLSLKQIITPDGIESTFAVNYLSHYLLSRLLTGLLIRSAPARVLTVSGHPAIFSRATIDWNHLAVPGRFDPIERTIQAALAKILFSFELGRRLEGTGVVSHTFHPGLVRSGLARHLPIFLKPAVWLATRLMSPSCPTGVSLAVDPQAGAVQSGFFIGRKAVPVRFKALADGSPVRLWDESEHLVIRHL